MVLVIVSVFDVVDLASDDDFAVSTVCVAVSWTVVVVVVWIDGNAGGEAKQDGYAGEDGDQFFHIFVILR